METMSSVASTSAKPVPQGNLGDAEYGAYLARVGQRLHSCDQEPLFTTDASLLFEAYLSALPVDQRQYHNCHCCRHFVERFGGLVTINERGKQTPAFWSEEDAPEVYRPAVAKMIRIVAKAKVTGVFLSADKVWGNPVTGKWTHLSIVPSVKRRYAKQVLSASQAMAEKSEDHKNVARALREYNPAIIEKALIVLRSEQLYRSEKVLGQAEWLDELHDALAEASNRDNVLWRAVATAPAGFCHPRSSMIGTLLDDLMNGLGFEDVSRKFADKMHPLRYQRPQAPPAAGTIAQAEKIVAQLHAEGALERRFARLDDVIEKLWTPTPPAAPSGKGVFGHLMPKDTRSAVDPVVIPASTVTWVKFARDVLPTAERIDLLVGPESNNYAALVTAVYPGAPPILQWDSPERRNPVSWYLWVGGSRPSQWGINVGPHKVSAITLKPNMWFGGDFAHQGEGVLFLIEGAKETRVVGCGAAIFPDTLRSEFHGVRSVIEAFSQKATLAGREEASACGLILSKGTERWNARVRVTTKNSVAEYRLDRWE